jgi:hypothetical protein
MPATRKAVKAAKQKDGHGAVHIKERFEGHGRIAGR